MLAVVCHFSRVIVKPDDETAVVSTMLCTIHLTPAPPGPGKLGGGTVTSISLGLPCTVWPSVAVFRMREDPSPVSNTHPHGLPGAWTHCHHFP